jgi:hypothetical protein
MQVIDGVGMQQLGGGGTPPSACVVESVEALRRPHFAQPAENGFFPVAAGGYAKRILYSQLPLRGLTYGHAVYSMAGAAHTAVPRWLKVDEQPFAPVAAARCGPRLLTVTPFSR